MLKKGQPALGLGCRKGFLVIVGNNVVRWMKMFGRNPKKQDENLVMVVRLLYQT